MRLARAHGLGNDYLVLELGPPLDAALVRAICDRHTGVGADGILEPRAGQDADYGVRIWNPDGSVAEKSGNGLRIFAHWLVRHGAAPTFTVWTGHDTVGCEVVGATVRVDMGIARFEDPPGCVLQVDGAPVRVVPVDLGNPHCVRFVDQPLDALPWRAWGEVLERHPHFPHRTNVQVARVGPDGGLAIRIWERGAGPTLASGSSACAVTAAAVRTGRLAAGPHPVHMPGGVLHVTVEPGFRVYLQGPVEAVGVIEVDPAWLAARRG